MSREPLLTIGTITAGVTAVIALLVAYGINVTQEQQVAILGVVAFVAPFIVVYFSRPKVTPVDAPQTNDGFVLQKSSVRAK